MERFKREQRLVFCPLLQKNIDGDGDCFDIAMVAEKLAPKTCGPYEAFVRDDWKEICLSCPNHIQD